MIRLGIRRSSTFRVALVYMALFGTSVCLLLAFIYWSTAGYMARQADATIEAEILGLAEQYRSRGLEGLSAVLRERVARNPDGSSLYLFATPDRRALAGNLNRWPDVEPDEAGWVTFPLYERSDDGETGRPHLGRARVFVLRGGLHLLVGRDMFELWEIRRLLVRALGWGLALTAALALAGGVMMSRSAARRIEAINQTSREIMGGDLERRVPTDGSGDDFDQLAGNLNEMLDRIQALMTRVRQVSDDVAHDLKTPLTRLRNHLEGLQRPRAPSAARSVDPAVGDAVDAALAEADRLLSMFNAVLRIASIESGARRVEMRSVDLAPVVRDVAELYEPLAGERGQLLAVDLGPSVSVAGDPDLLFQAFANVVDNAIKYGPAGGHISVMLSRLGLPGGADRAVVTVSDGGPGIPPEDRERVFQRFFRLEGSRTAPGNGLGLSLVEAVAKLHGGSVELMSNEPGLRVIIALPALGEPSR